MNDPDPTRHQNSPDDSSAPANPNEDVQYLGEVSHDGNSEAQNNEPYVAEIADEAKAGQIQPNSSSFKKHGIASTSASMVDKPPVEIAQEFKNISAIGGAVGAMVLGVWSIICALITPFAFISAVLALLMGIYGLSSRRKKLAVLGMLLGGLGLAMSLFETNEIISVYFAEEAAGNFDG